MGASAERRPQLMHRSCVHRHQHALKQSIWITHARPGPLLFYCVSCFMLSKRHMQRELLLVYRGGGDGATERDDVCLELLHLPGEIVDDGGARRPLLLGVRD